MASPTTVKTWNTNTRSTKYTGTPPTPNGDVLIAIKDGLLASGGWSVVGSSYTNLSSMDGTDRWTHGNGLLWNLSGSQHSWIVLRNTTITSKFDLCIDCKSNNYGMIDVVVSPANGFGSANGGTDGNGNLRPTATDEVVAYSQVLFMDKTTGNEANANGYEVITTACNDSTCYRCYIVSNNLAVGAFWIEKPRNPHPLWTSQWMLSVVGSGTTGATVLTEAFWTNIATTVFKPTSSSPLSKLYMAVPWTNGSSYLAQVNTNGFVGTAYDFYEPLLISESPGSVGVWGSMFDLYRGSTLAPTNLDQASDNTKWTYIKPFWVYLNSNVWWL